MPYFEIPNSFDSTGSILKSFNKRFKSPAWKTRAVRHSGIRTQRQISKRATSTASAYIPFASHHSLPAGIPKNRGRRLHLELLP